MGKRALVLALSVCALVAATVFSEGKPEKETPAAATAGGPQYGGTLTQKIWWNGNGTQTWDTSDLAKGISAHTWTSPYAETLLIGDIDKYGPRGNKEYAFTAWELVPEQYLKGALAESWEWTAPLTLVYHIRHGVMWAPRKGVMDARELTADDIAFSMNRTWKRFREQGNVEFNYVKSITARDKYTLVIELNSFYADWAFHLGYRGIVQAIYPPEAAKAGPADWRNAVGTGPFILTDYVDGSEAVYEKNPSYWGTAVIDGKEYKLPFVDKLVIPIIPDMSTQVAALRTGKIDWVINVPLEYTDTLKKTSPDLKLSKYLAGQTDFASLKMTEPPFDNKNVRRALMIGTDWEAVATTVYGEADIYAEPLNALTPYWVPPDKLPPNIKELYSNDPAKAKKMLVDAGYPNGFKMQMYAAADSEKSKAAIELLKDQWQKRFNINLELMPVEGAVLGGLVSGRGSKERPGDYHGSVIMTMSTCSPWVCLDRVGLITSFKNPARYDSKYFADGFAKAKAERDPAKRAALLTDISLHWLDDVPYLPFPNPYNQTAYWPWVRNYYGEVESAYYNFVAMQARIWIDQKQKKSMGF
jgi:peptide/nickel transport system substrate-binding protein